METELSGMNDITLRFKKELMETLRGLPATSNNTKIVDVVGAGTDNYKEYPVVRVVPQSITREVDADLRTYTYTPIFTISVYLELGDAEYADEEIINTMLEIVDSIYNRLDSHEWETILPAGSKIKAESSIVSAIDTLPTKTGTALYCDIQYPLSVLIPF